MKMKEKFVYLTPVFRTICHSDMIKFVSVLPKLPILHRFPNISNDEVVKRGKGEEVEGMSGREGRDPAHGLRVLRVQLHSRHLLHLWARARRRVPVGVAPHSPQRRQPGRILVSAGRSWSRGASPAEKWVQPRFATSLPGSAWDWLTSRSLKKIFEIDQSPCRLAAVGHLVASPVPYSLFPGSDSLHVFIILAFLVLVVFQELKLLNLLSIFYPNINTGLQWLARGPSLDLGQDHRQTNIGDAISSHYDLQPRNNRPGKVMGEYLQVKIAQHWPNL